MFASHGIEVTGVDINTDIIRTLLTGSIHIHEPGLLPIVKEQLQLGNLKVAHYPALADAFIIAVLTPFDDNKKADMSAVKSAAEAIVPFLDAGNLVVLESTSPPSTTSDVVRSILERTDLKAGRDFYLAYSPERVLPGQILRELIENDRVIGSISPACTEAGKALYSRIVTREILTTDATTAEMVKLMENTYRDVNIAIANEFFRSADRFGINVWDTIALANNHPRVNILNPGPGVDGHCISVDPWFLVDAVPDITQLIRAARLVNDDQPKYVVELIKDGLGGWVNKKVALLGMAYKPNVDDLRESPAVEVAHLLSHAGVDVMAFEPFKPDVRISGFNTFRSLEETLVDADAIVFLVAHGQFLDLNPKDVLSKTRSRLIFDTVNALRSSEWEQEGFSIIKLGASKSNTKVR